MGPIQKVGGPLAPKVYQNKPKTTDAQALSDSIKQLGGSLTPKQLSSLEDSNRDPYSVMKLPNGNFLTLFRGSSAYEAELFNQRDSLIQRGINRDTLTPPMDESFQAFEIKPDGVIIPLKDSNMGVQRDGGTTYGTLQGGSVNTLTIPYNMNKPELPAKVTMFEGDAIEVPSVKFQTPQ
jgi:hypothetical protein